MTEVPPFATEDSKQRKRALWLAIRDAAERLQTEPRPWDVPSANDADVILAAILPLLPEFERDTNGEEYHRCYCKRGYDHASNL